MKAKKFRLLAFLSSSKQFVIPIYQRPYRWEEARCASSGTMSPRWGGPGGQRTLGWLGGLHPGRSLFGHRSACLSAH